MQPTIKVASYVAGTSELSKATCNIHALIYSTLVHYGTLVHQQKQKSSLSVYGK